MVWFVFVFIENWNLIDFSLDNTQSKITELFSIDKLFLSTEVLKTVK